MTSFVPSLTTKGGVEYRLSKLEEIKIKIFDLVYYGHFGYGELSSMTSAELNWYHSHLIETKDRENEAREKAIREAKVKQQEANNKAKYAPRRSIRSRRR